MRLTYRPAILQDIDRCFEQLGDSFAYDPQARSCVPQVWRRLLANNLLSTTVIEDLDRPPERRIVGFGASVFVSDAFMEQARNSMEPYLRAQLIHRILAGDSPVLSLSQGQQANVQDGLNLFFLNDVLSDRTLTTDELRCVHGAWSEPLYALRACRLKEAIWECYGRRTYEWAAGCGLLLRNDWAGFWQNQVGSAPPDDQRPYLLGITRAESLTQPGTHASFLFHHTPARFSFTVGQQELLAGALRGATDEELAQSLSLSVSAVKKRWFAIYERVELCDPQIVIAGSPADMTTSVVLEQKRGAEKRRHLLNYLRYHPEELHPINAYRA